MSKAAIARLKTIRLLVSDTPNDVLATSVNEMADLIELLIAERHWAGQEDEATYLQTRKAAREALARFGGTEL